MISETHTHIPQMWGTPGWASRAQGEQGGDWQGQAGVSALPTISTARCPQRTAVLLFRLPPWTWAWPSHRRHAKTRGKPGPALLMRGFPGGLDSKESACNAGDPGSVPGLGVCPGEGKGHPLQCSYLETPRDRGARRAIVHGIAKSRTWLSNYHFRFSYWWNAHILFF